MWRVTKSLAHSSRVLLCLVLVGAIVCQFSGQVFAAAIPTRDQQAIDGNWEHWDNSTRKKCGGTGTTTAKPGPVYFLGDSIGTQVGPGLQAAFDAAGTGWQVKNNAVSG